MSEILIYQNENGNIKVDVMFEDGSIWLSQAQICELFGKAKSTISEHIKAIFEEEELNPISTVRNYRTVQKEGNREVERDIEYYNLDMIIAIGFRVRSSTGTKFRIWANDKLKEYITKGFVLNKDWIARLDAVISLNGRELLTNAGKISHEMAIAKSELEYQKFKDEQKKIEKIQSLKELEEDIKRLK